jgi:hypothetical protein
MEVYIWRDPVDKNYFGVGIKSGKILLKQADLFCEAVEYIFGSDVLDAAEAAEGMLLVNVMAKVRH